MMNVSFLELVDEINRQTTDILVSGIVNFLTLRELGTRDNDFKHRISFI